jgi:mannose-6-phosphate isomerase-like protein (cupin superfamily)
MFARSKPAMDKKLAAEGLPSALVASYRRAYHQTRVEHNPVVIDPPEAVVKVLYLNPGERTPVHIHQKSTDIMVLLKGTGIATVNGEDRKVKAGTVILNPMGTKHGLQNSGKSKLKWLLVQAPRPEPKEAPPLIYQ